MSTVDEQRHVFRAAAFTLAILGTIGVTHRSRTTRTALDAVPSGEISTPEFDNAKDRPVQSVGHENDIVVNPSINKDNWKNMDTVISPSTLPHLVLFTVDDLGWNDIGYTSTDLPKATPYATSLASQGVKITHYYTQPSCTPSRATMMTGKFAYRNGFQNYELQHADAVGVPLSNKLMPELLKDLGYETHGVGKWNIGHCSSKYLPHERGFDHYLGYMCPGHGYRDYQCGMSAGVMDMIEGWATTTDGETSYEWATGAQYKGTYDTLLYRETAVAAIKHHYNAHTTDVNDKPFFLWAAMHGIHAELDADPIPPDEMLTVEDHAYLKGLEKAMSPHDTDEERTFFKMRLITASVLMSVDNCLKRIVETLEETGMFANTVLFFHSDNGGDTEYNKGHPGNNFPLRSEKFSYFEGGIRVPAFVVAPGRIPANRVGSSYHGLMHHVDLLTTFYGLANGDVHELKATHTDLDGYDQWPSILGETRCPRNELVLNLPRSVTWKFAETATNEGVAIRVGNFKMLINHPFDWWFSPGLGDDHHDVDEMYASMCKYNLYSVNANSKCVYEHFLFDLSVDPHERDNLWTNDDYKTVKQAMINRVHEIIADQTTVGHTGKTYGAIIYEAYEKRPMHYSEAFKEYGEYVVPWKCDVIG